MVTNGTNSTANSSVEYILRDIWTDVLGTPPLDRRANFFDSGGTSLAAFRLLRRVEERFGAGALAPADVFDTPTFADYVAVVARATGKIHDM
jgi:hypothetical protein